MGKKMPSNFNVGMRPDGDRQCLMRFVSDVDLFSFSCRNDMVRQASSYRNSTITLGSSEDVPFTVELDRAALSRTGVRNGLSRENTEGRSKGCHGQHHHHDLKDITGGSSPD